MRVLRTSLAAASCVAIVALGGCKVEETRSPDAQAAGEAAAPSGTLQAGLARNPGTSTVASALQSTGIGGIFEGKGSYTLIAPTDEAFSRLGDKANQLAAPDQKAALTAILRDHIVPGYLRVQDIAAAIDAADGKPVRMRTMGTSQLSFAKSGRDIVVTASNGSSGKLVGDGVNAKTGIALPVDTVLKKV